MTQGYTQFDIQISGDALLMHNGQLADPLNVYTKRLAAVTKDRSRKKTEEGVQAIMEIEYEAGLYLDAKQRPTLPTRILEAHLCEAARKTKEGKSALSGLFVDTDAEFSYEGGPMTVPQLVKSAEHRLTVPVRVQKNRVLRTRPLFKNWKAKFRVSLLDETADKRMLEEWLSNGGRLVGLGDYRPRYGRYQVDSVKEVA